MLKEHWTLKWDSAYYKYMEYIWPIQENHRQEDHLREENYPLTYKHQTETC